MNALRAPVVLSFVCAALWAACGGDDSSGSSDDPVALCKEFCGKSFSLCYADAGSLGDQIKAACENSCSNPDGGGSTTTCTNASEITSAFKGCLSKTTSDDFMSCQQAIPPCAGGGTGGTGGSGGSTGGTGGGGTGGGGTGGSSGGGADGGTGMSCADLLACCNANTNDQIKAACMSAYMTAMGADATCAMYLAALKSTVCP